MVTNRNLSTDRTASGQLADLRATDGRSGDTSETSPLHQNVFFVCRLEGEQTKLRM